MTRDIHVLPVDDLIEHVESETCWCVPFIESVRELDDGVERRVIVHTAHDGRELVERHGVN